MMEPSPESPHSHSRLSHKLPIRSFPAPVSPGQLIYVKLLSRLSIEGYAMQALDPSYWEDASLLRPELETKKRPAVVLDVKKLDRDTYWKVKVLPIRRGSARGKEGGDAAAISLSPQRLETGAIEEWSWAEIVAFAFPCAETFVCLPNQVNRFMHLPLCHTLTLRFCAAHTYSRPVVSSRVNLRGTLAAI